jgi:hypothetical protein
VKKILRMEATTRDDLVQIFSRIDRKVLQRKGRLAVTVIGGVALILQGIRERSTRDIDIALSADAVAFQDVCSTLGIPVDIVTVASTVDLVHAPKISLFEGEALTVDSVLPEDLIRLKLERFRKQDPEDIEALIAATRLSYERFKAICEDMLPDFIGNPRELALSAMIVVERIYPEHRDDFEALLSEVRRRFP